MAKETDFPIPNGIGWMWHHAAASLEGRTGEEINDICCVAIAIDRTYRAAKLESAITATYPDGTKDVVSYYSSEEDKLASIGQSYAALGATVAPSTPDEIRPAPIAESLYRYLVLFHKDMEDAENSIAAFAQDYKVEGIKAHELFFSLALAKLKAATTYLAKDGSWTPTAAESFSEAAAACALAAGLPMWKTWVFRGDIETARDHGRLGGLAKGKKADPVRELVQKEWEKRKKGESKRAFAMRIRPLVIAFAKERNIPFAPSNADRRIAEMV